MVNIAVLVSGGGTNLQAILDAQARGDIHNGRVSVVVSSNDKAYALERAKQAGVPGVVRRKKDYASGAEYCRALAQFLQEQDIGLIVLAGFMTVLDEEFCKNFENRIINVHPSLIPSFCGDGFYGLHVHEAALEKGVKVTGATVHFVNAITDGGPIIAQKAVAVEPDDTPEILQKRVMAQAEHILLPRAVSLFCEGKLSVSDSGIVSISE
ncbi:phosphoribosylglycinamide formyltransferase [Butyricicoccus intestinisimiae]|uniref:Phosphoribosylglycinamide formyltransferase n=1 Tax=Butyricicoccus intestinisimiae TaxID=2841509 RepID=A0ABS6ETP4_9FIRM|nr:phosphoribosylglycinamide formyltransferase [Butyricicoccus intestinisimiae]MBU5491076.1 phosphoribosylglycinamide formyltransferase [Butyricicoccus intestinisimiae]